MKKGFKKLAVFSLALCLIMGSFVACGGEDEEIVAIVGGETEITKAHNDEMVQLFAYLQQYDLSEFDEEMMQQVSDSILEFSVENEVLKLHFKDQDVLPSDIDDQFQQFLDSAYGQEGVKEAFEEKGITEVGLRYYFESQYYSQAFLEEMKEQDPITEEEMKAYYDENKESFKEEEQVKASHILIGDSEHTDADREKAEALRAQVVADPDSFAEVAKENSVDTGSAESGGDVGFFPRTGAMVEEFSAAAFELGVGEISEVVESEYGFHIIMTTEKKEAGYATYEDSKESIESTLGNELYTEGMAVLKEEVGVEYIGREEEATEETPVEEEGATPDTSTDGAANEGDSSDNSDSAGDE